MNTAIQKAIEKYYMEKEASDYLTKCKRKTLLPEEVNAFVTENNITIEVYNNKGVWPSTEIFFEFEGYTKREFSVTYTSKLLVSKVAPLFYLQHEFIIDNKDINRIVPMLDGDSAQAYTKKQLDLELFIEDHTQY
ncbi:hypothetical protein WAK64_10855 [Bacillus spongiae]|uniref:Uncharacterized protein n=1 Tax=Bacillus spongiae TaxID=2683610 RepID=A0ABU8HEE9_9BACI